VPLTAAVLTLTSLPFRSVIPANGLDASWVVALSLAHVQGLHHGTDLTFTYGPLGVLATPSEAYLRGAVLGILYAAVTAGALYAALCAAVRRWLPTSGAVAVVAAFSITAVAVPVPELGAMALMVVAVGLLQPSALGQPLAKWIPPALGALAALQLCVKFSVGIFFIVVTAVIVLARPGRRLTAPLASGSFVTALVVLWARAGQRLGDLPEWIRVSLLISSGYSDAMAIQGIHGFDWLGWILLAAPAGLLAAWSTLRLVRDGRPYVPLVVLVGLTTWLFVKTGFVRLEHIHRDVTFVALAALILAVSWFDWQRFAALAVAGLCMCTLFVTVGVHASPSEIVRWHPNALKEVAHVARLAIDKDRRTASLERRRAGLLSAYGLDATVMAQVQGTVHADPWDVSAVWAGQFAWRPVPVFQTYSAYDRELDHANADALRSTDAPDTILRRSGDGIDDRLPIWESPEYQVAMTCNYDHVIAEGAWEVLHASSGDRCREPVLLEEQTLAPGETGHVPRPRSPTSLVVVRLDYPVSPLHALITTALKPLHLSSVLVDGAKYRFISGTAGQPHLLSVPGENVSVPNAGLDLRSIVFPNADGTVVARYYEIPIN
jgi:hypothetical protein